MHAKKPPASESATPEDKPEQAKKLIRIELGGLTRMEYNAYFRVPANMTNEQLDALVDTVYEDTDATEFEDDTQFWERGECSWHPLHEDNTPDFEVICDEDGEVEEIRSLKKPPAPTPAPPRGVSRHMAHFDYGTDGEEVCEAVYAEDHDRVVAGLRERNVELQQIVFRLNAKIDELQLRNRGIVSRIIDKVVSAIRKVKSHDANLDEGKAHGG